MILVAIAILGALIAATITTLMFHGDGLQFQLNLIMDLVVNAMLLQAFYNSKKGRENK